MTAAELIHMRFGSGDRCAELPEIDDACPGCGEPELFQEHADIGVGIIWGPIGCPICGWSSWPEWDRTAGSAAAELDHPGYHADSRGGLLRISTWRGPGHDEPAPVLCHAPAAPRSA